MLIEVSTSKVKCIHTGVAPCHRCKRSQLEGCTLTRPKTPNAKTSRRTARLARSSAEAPGDVTEAQPNTPRLQGNRSCLERTRDGVTPHSRAAAFTDVHYSPNPSYNPDFVGQHVSSLPNGTVLKCLNVFTNKFPELAILHLPSFLDELRCYQSKETVALLSTVLAVTRSQICVLNADWASDLLPRAHYASYAKDLLRDLILQPPKLQVVQALLIITLHEWGSRDFHKAWVYCGTYV